jgi:sulfoxide reductase heme-binding subunit YedZ
VIPAETVWVVARATGTAALVALALSVISGAALRSGALGWLSHNRGVRAVHDLTSVLWIPLVVAHIVALLLDPYAKVGLADLVIPFQVSYGRLAVGLGTISTQLIGVVLLTTWLRSHLTPGGWIAVHRLSYVAFIGAFAHGLMAGTDLAQPLLAALAWVTAAVLGLVAFRRVTAARGRQPSARSRTVAIP